MDLTTSDAAATVPAQTPPHRMEHLDGIRGLAALFVAVCHCNVILLPPDPGIPRSVLHLLSPLEFGHYAVAVFIVLSGYCLMLPVARSRDGSVRGGAFSYIKRRARRILPPYYAALTLSLLVNALPFMRESHGFVTDMVLPAFSPGALWTHLLLIHNWYSEYFLKINSPLWSVAPEWQIYFLFLLLLPLRRRFGVLSAAAVAFVVGLLPHFLLPTVINGDWTAPWYLGLFGFGMAGACLTMTRSEKWQRLRRAIPWGGVSACCGGLLLWLCHRCPAPESWVYFPIGDQIVGIGTLCLLLYCAEAERQFKPGLFRRMLAAPALVALGTFSYSLYLTHFPLIGLGNYFFQCLNVGHAARSILIVLVLVPVLVAFAYLFHLLAERPFMSIGSTTTEKAQTSAVSSRSQIEQYAGAALHDGHSPPLRAET